MKDELWLSCKKKTCCSRSIVVPSGRDVWRIARALETPPWSFARYFLSPTPRPDGFYLDQSGRQFRLMLDKRVSRAAVPPCIFLMRTRGGHHRCGLGELRPAVCRTFASDLIDGVLCVHAEAGCTCRQWSLADVDVVEETARVEAREAEAAEYTEIVARWNAQVLAESTDEGHDFQEYCRFLLAAYDVMETVEVEEAVS